MTEWGGGVETMQKVRQSEMTERKKKQPVKNRWQGMRGKVMKSNCTMLGNTTEERHREQKNKHRREMRRRGK